MEHTSDGFERSAVALMELHQRVQVLIAEHRHLQAELAVLRQGAGIMVTMEGRHYPLVPGRAHSLEPLASPRESLLPRATSRPQR